MTKLMVVLMICLLVGVLVNAALATPTTLSDHQMSAIVAGDSASVDDTSQGVASDQNSGNQAAVGADGEAKIDNSTDNSVDNSDNSILKDLNATVTVDASKTDNSVDNSVEADKSFNTDNSVDNSVEADKSFNTDNSVDNSDNSVNKGNTGNLATAGGDAKIDNSVDNSVDNSLKVIDSVYVTGMNNASGINLINANGKVNAGSNILAVAAVNSGGGTIGNVGAEIDSSIITQSVMNSSFIIVGAPAYAGPSN
jgi:cytoskeletal protein RodZ